VTVPHDGRTPRMTKGVPRLARDETAFRIFIDYPPVPPRVIEGPMLALPPPADGPSSMEVEPVV